MKGAIAFADSPISFPSSANVLTRCMRAAFDVQYIPFSCSGTSPVYADVKQIEPE